MEEKFKSVGHASQGRFTQSTDLANGIVAVTHQELTEHNPDYCTTPVQVIAWLDRELFKADAGSGWGRALKFVEKELKAGYTSDLLQRHFAALHNRYDRLYRDIDVQADDCLQVYVTDVVTGLFVIEHKCLTAGMIGETWEHMMHRLHPQQR